MFTFGLVFRVADVLYMAIAPGWKNHTVPCDLWTVMNTETGELLPAIPKFLTDIVS